MDISSPNVAVIGAGLAGLSCARRLREYGVGCTIFDRGRRVGGRISSRKILIGTDEVVFNHGAPMIHARSVDFERVLRQWTEDGFATERDHSLSTMSSECDRTLLAVTGVPDMQQIAEQIARDLDVRCSCHVHRIHRSGDCWDLEYMHYERGSPESERFGIVVFACPFEQASRVLAESGESLPEQLRDRSMLATWVCMLVIETEQPLIAPLDRISTPPTTLIASIEIQWRNSNRLGVLAQMPNSTSTACMTADSEEIEQMMVGPMLQIIANALGIDESDQKVVFQRAHRWGLAFPHATIPCTHLLDAEQCLGFAGDSFGGADCAWRDAEAAYLSGLALADDIARMVKECMGRNENASLD